MTQDNGQQWGQPQDEPTRSRSGQQPYAPYTQQPQYTQAPQYGQQPQAPQYAQYQPPQPPKKKHRARNVSLGIIGGAAVIIIAAAAASGGNASNNSATANAPGAVVATGAPAHTSAAPAAPAKRVVLVGSGSGIKNTADFTTGSDWSIAYTFNCKSFGSEGNFQIYVYDGSDLSDVPANDLATKGGATSYEHGESGTHYLQINSECAWTVKVTDNDGGQ